MSHAEVKRLWEECEDHVNVTLAGAANEEAMLLFVEIMCQHYRGQGYSESLIRKIRRLIGKRVTYYRQLRPEYSEHKIPIDLKTERYIIIPRSDEKRVLGMIDTRNGQVINKITYRTGP
jgi:hypothetical protein